MLLRLAFHCDMDGTLWCNEGRNRSVAQNVALDHCPALASLNADFWDAVWRDCAGKTETHLHAYLAAKGYELECSATEYEQICRGQWSARRNEAVIDEHMLRFVFQRRLEGHAASIVTSSRAQDVTDFFAVLRDRAYFERPQDLFYAIVSSDDVTPAERKPHPRPYLLSAERMGRNPTQNNIWIGDSASDLSGAAAFPNTGKNFGIFKNPDPTFDLPPHAVLIRTGACVETAYHRCVLPGMGLRYSQGLFAHL